jgi:hypothetical protein
MFRFLLGAINEPEHQKIVPIAEDFNFCKFSFVSTLDQSELRRGATVNTGRHLNGL